jgi:sugar/nucleoside kinase (ribokinase family)
MTAPAAPRILCAGMAVLDEVFRVECAPAANSKTRASAFASVIGGCAANAAIAVARLGGAAALAAALGEAGRDEVGDRILAGLAREGVGACGIVRVAGASSTISSILVEAGGDRMIATYCDERLFSATVEDPGALVADVDVMLADNWLPDLVVPICAAARERGLPVVIDGDGPMNPRDALLALGTHIVFSADALRASTGRAELPGALADVSRHTRGFLAVTDGADDILWWEDGPHRLPAFAVAAVDTLAAGDVFHGAFALALAEGLREVEALRFAAGAAAVKCTRFGGGSAAPRRSEVEALVGRTLFTPG